MSILESIGFKKRFHVGISLSPNNFIELVGVDSKTKTVVAYASGNVKYNNAVREIIEYEEFGEVVESLFNDAGISPSECAVTVNIPNVQFGLSTYEPSVEDYTLIENIQSEIEDLYVFKRSGNEPTIGFSRINNSSRTLAFSAIQSNAVRKIIEIFDGIGCELVRIESSYSAFLKSLQFCDRFSKYMKKDETTTILLVTANNCTSFFIEDGCITDFYEEPIAVKSFSKDEVYATLSKLLTNMLSKNMSQSLLIVSETDEVDPQLLVSQVSFQGEVDTINKGINANEKFIEFSIDYNLDDNMLSYITIEAVGAAVADYDNYPVDINYLPIERRKKNLIKVGEYEVDLTVYLVTVLAFAAFITAVIVFSILALINVQTDNIQNESQKAEESIEIFKKKSASMKTRVQGLYPSLKSIVEKNKSTTDIFTALSTDIPENVYINNFATNEDGGMLISGKAKSADAVKEFVASLKAKNNDLHLSKFAVDESDGNLTSNASMYIFEIKTQSIPISFSELEMKSKTNNQNSNRRTLNGSKPIL